jgi:ABC-type branched-subunit amino acid transport system ATPase component
MTGIAVRTEGLGKRYGRNWALSDCTLEIPAGSVTALVGPNGAGKTTLLHLVIGLAAPTDGVVEVLGHAPRGDAKTVLPRSDSSRRTTRSIAISPSPRRSSSDASSTRAGATRSRSPAWNGSD